MITNMTQDGYMKIMKNLVKLGTGLQTMAKTT